MKVLLSTILMTMGSAVALATVSPDISSQARDNVEKAMAIIDATWEKGAINRFGDAPTSNDLAFADWFSMETDQKGGPADVWPYTAAIEALNSVIESLDALAAADESQQQWVSNVRQKYLVRLNQVIDNLEWYKGEYTLASYATIGKKVTPYAVPRAGARGTADVSGILNVYDDQMWIARELIRAYRLTDNREYLNRAVYLTDYVLEGWDCWRDENGKEYGGITWGPGYNSKHACSNAPIIQPLVWLSEIYAEFENNEALTDAEKEFKFYSRDDANKVFVDKVTPRSEYYLDFAKKIYDWQKANLLDPTKNVYYDMMGADNTIKVSGGYRQHVDTGTKTGAFISYNTGTMISGASELYAVTQDEAYLTDIDNAVKGSYNQFSKQVRSKATYEFQTDATVMNGFNTWFNCVLIRSYADAFPYCSNVYAKNGLNYMLKNLNYAFDNADFNKGNILPIKLLDGWNSEVSMKPFHQFAFAAEYGVIASHLIRSNDEASSSVETIAEDRMYDDTVYSLTGVKMGKYSSVKDNLPAGIYIYNGKKILVK